MTLRCYCFTNMYISPIQCGIQSAHCIAELFVKYKHTVSEKGRILDSWSIYDKTMIVLNGGYQSRLLELDQHFSADQNIYPHSIFKEEQDALNGATTCVSIVLPDKIFDSPIRSQFKTVAELDSFLELVNLTKHSPEENDRNLTAWELKTAILLNEFKLA